MCFTIRAQSTTDILFPVFTWYRVSRASSIATFPIITRPWRSKFVKTTARLNI